MRARADLSATTGNPDEVTRPLAGSATIGGPEYRKSFLEGEPENARTFSLARA